MADVKHVVSIQGKYIVFQKQNEEPIEFSPNNSYIARKQGAVGIRDDRKELFLTFSELDQKTPIWFNETGDFWFNRETFTEFIRENTGFLQTEPLQTEPLPEEA